MRDRGFRAALLVSAALSGCTALAGFDKDYGLVCEPGAARACYSGTAGTEGTGPCKGGQQVCNPDGFGYGDCIGEVVPGTEDCATTEDEDCDGETLDQDAGCVCKPGSNASCYSGPPGTEGAGVCAAGTHVCNELGTAYGSCNGEILPNVELCTTATADENCDGEALCTGDLLWSKRFGDASNQYGTSVTTDSAGNILLTGHFEGSVDFGGGTLTSAGSNDVFVAKFDPNGGLLWSKRFGDASAQYSQSITTDSAGNALLTGFFDGSVDFGGGTLTSEGFHDIFVAKFNPNGDLLWSKRFGDASNQWGQSITTDSAGNALLTGYFDGIVEFGGAPLTSAGGHDIFVAKLDRDGNHLWSNRFGDTSTPVHSQYGNSITTDSAGNVLLTGFFVGSVGFGGKTLTSAGDKNNDIFVAKLDPGGNLLWSYHFGDASDQKGDSITTDSAGNVLLTGYFEGSVNFDGGIFTSVGLYDIFVAKLDRDGNHLWSDRFGDTSNQNSTSITTDSAGNVLLTGYFEGSVNFGGKTLTSTGGTDIFLAKLAP